MKKLLLCGTVLLLLTGCVPAEKMTTYKNAEYNFQFDYPESFTVTNANYGNQEKKIVQVQLPSSAYPKTNFNDAAFTVSVSDAKTISQCLGMNNPEGGHLFKDSITSNGGVKFYETPGLGKAAGNLYETKVSRTFTGTQCFEMVETVHTSNIGNYDPKTTTEVDTKPVWEKLDKILPTFKFTAKK